MPQREAAPVPGKFLSTPSVGRATAKVPKKQLHFCIKPYNRFFIYREILPELQRNRQNNLRFTPKIRCDSPG